MQGQGSVGSGFRLEEQDSVVLGLEELLSVEWVLVPLSAPESEPQRGLHLAPQLALVLVGVSGLTME